MAGLTPSAGHKYERRGDFTAHSLAICVQKNIANQAGIKVKDDLGIEAREKVLVPSLSAGGSDPAYHPAQRSQKTCLRSTYGTRDSMMRERFPYSLTPAATRLKCRMSPILTVCSHSARISYGSYPASHDDWALVRRNHIIQS